MVSANSQVALRFLVCVLLASNVVSAVAVRNTQRGTPVRRSAVEQLDPAEIDGFSTVKADPGSFWHDLLAFASDYHADDLLRFIFGKWLWKEETATITTPSSTILTTETPVSAESSASVGFQTITVSPSPVAASRISLSVTPGASSAVTVSIVSAPPSTTSNAVIDQMTPAPSESNIAFSLLTGFPAVPWNSSVRALVVAAASSNSSVDVSTPTLTATATKEPEIHILPFPYPIETTAVMNPVNISIVVIPANGTAVGVPTSTAAVKLPVNHTTPEVPTGTPVIKLLTNEIVSEPLTNTSAVVLPTNATSSVSSSSNTIAVITDDVVEPVTEFAPSSLSLASVRIFSYPLIINTTITAVKTPSSTFVLPPGPRVTTTTTYTEPIATVSPLAKPEPEIEIEIETETETIILTLPSPTSTKTKIQEIQIVPFPISRSKGPSVKPVTETPAVISDFWNITMSSVSAAPSPTALSNETETDSTLTIRRTSTLYITKTVRPSLISLGTSIGTSVGLSIGNAPPAVTATVRWTNTTAPDPSLSSIILSFGTLPILTPIPSSTPLPFPDTNPNSSIIFISTPRNSLLSLCRTPSIHKISLPLLSTFYGPNAYPLLNPFPGCIPPTLNSSQALRAPGLLNCTALGAQVQACQRLGRKILLSIKAAPGSAVAGNLDYGLPGSNPRPFGPYFGDFGPGGLNESRVQNRQPNLFDERHPPSAFALTLFSLFGEGHAERADLRPLGPDAPSPVSPDGTRWWNKPLGEEVVVDGFDVRVPREWKEKYQAGQFQGLVKRLRELVEDSWGEAGGVSGGAKDLGTDGKGVVVLGWV